MDEYMKSLRDKLLYIIGAEDYTYREMAVQCGISERKLEEIINRRTPKGLHFSTLVRMSEYLDIPISELIGDNKKICGGG